MTIERFARQGDEQSATMLREILAEEVTHVAAGMRWFRHIADADDGTEHVIEVRNTELEISGFVFCVATLSDSAIINCQSCTVYQ